ncbi:hypothetical protein JI721_03095 [Alicyclobacillus cycloheptanicus]|uniref:Uncharacterized protein n=1 Tax=Alicyclobacillus cycloheptanicus TaxID=1457 RepID=A0ABT9XK47_9BACL|nr:hypothetical protein [Alicyclobacillus cycloheptanicus]MDQ0190650.1 hypothetical protein [Alicyclobacillus cycloheptanicus]WDM01848.1 hypothetical protein JI721_03095 [Alicyclobacillus cycloheptanicus]
MAWGNDELTQYANAANIELPVPLATMFGGEYDFSDELGHVRNAFQRDSDLIELLESFSESHLLLVKFYVYENDNDNVDLMTSAKAITLQPGKHLSDVIAEFVMWISTHAK